MLSSLAARSTRARSVLLGSQYEIYHDEEEQYCLTFSPSCGPSGDNFRRCGPLGLVKRKGKRNFLTTNVLSHFPRKAWSGGKPFVGVLCGVASFVSSSEVSQLVDARAF